MWSRPSYPNKTQKSPTSLQRSFSLVPPEKMREATLYGAEVIKVSGTYDETKQVAAAFAQRRGIHLDHGAKAIPGKESMKTLGFEIA